MSTIQVAGRTIGPGHPVFIIAELSANHNHDLETARRSVVAAKEAGADAIKVQTYTADTLTLDSDAEPFIVRGGTLWDKQRLHALYSQAMMPWEWQPQLQALARELGIVFFSSPFDATAVAFLENLDVPVYKIASFELVDIPLIRKVASTGRPMIMSTGMSTVEEIEDAVAAARHAGCTQLALLRCNSAYPAPDDEMDLATIGDMSARFGVPIGLSDHTLGPDAAVTAVAAGACILEKHFTVSREVGGPDAAFSMEPDELADLVARVRRTERLLGRVRYGPSAHERPSLAFRRSIFVVRDVRAGEPFTSDNVRSIRPAHGLAPKHYEAVLGRRAARDLAAGTPLAWDAIADPPPSKARTPRRR